MQDNNKIAQSAAMLAVFTLVSKVLGFIREILIASRFGSGFLTDTYFAAMTATVIIISTIGGALNTSLIPIFVEVETRHGIRGKRKFLNNLLNIIIVAAILIMIIGYIGSPLIIRLVAKGFQGEQFDLAVKLNRIGLPIVLFLGLTYVFSGYLQSAQIFGPQAIMGIPYNFVFIIFLLFFANKGSIEGLMATTVIAGSTQFLIHVPGVLHQRYRYVPRIDIYDRYVKKTLVLIFPILIGQGVQQINTIIDRTLASGLREGSISALSYANRINELVISVFVMAITTVIFPILSKAFSDNDNDQIKAIMGKGINFILLITIPATIGLIILAEPIVRIFFQRGAFTETATTMTSQALIFYSIGLVGYAFRIILGRVYYSLHDTKTPMVNGIIAVGLNIVLNLVLVRYMDHSGLALATSISATLAALLLLKGLRKKLGPIGLTSYLINSIKALFASIVMGVTVYTIFSSLTNILPDRAIAEMIAIFASVGLGVIIYFLLSYILQIKEIYLILEKFRKNNKNL